jgi:hypothetical protein
MARSLDLDELVEHWTLLDDERELISGKRGPTRLGFALLLKFYTGTGRFPRGRGELLDEAVEFVAWQVGVEPGGARAVRVVGPHDRVSPGAGPGLSGLHGILWAAGDSNPEPMD